MRWYIARATAEKNAKECGMSVETYNMIVNSTKNMKKGIVSKPVDIDRVKKALEI